MRFKILLQTLMVCTLMVTANAWGEVVGREVEYRAGDTVMKGYLAENIEVKGKRPAVLVVHEWWGLNEYPRKRARMLAEQGYTALAVDMYGDGQTVQHPDEAARLSREVMNNKTVLEARFKAALEYIKQVPTVESTRVAAIGYCFGGSVVLHMARRGANLRGVASFHGNLATDTPAKPGMVRAKLLVVSGEADPLVPQSQVDAFKDEMDKAGGIYAYIGYPGALHAFTNPDADKYAGKFKLPTGYDRRADRDAWKETLGFLKEVFRR